MRLIARIGEAAHFNSSKDLRGEECPPSASEYTLDIPIGMGQDPEILRILAHGLFFDNDWTADGTVSCWFTESGLVQRPKILSHEDKVRLYSEKKYTFPPPPVNPSQWGIDSWIRYIDCYGTWTP